MTDTKPKVCKTPTAKQQRVWDKAAAGYDKQIAFFERIQFTGGREWLAERAQGRVLEVAIGTGRSLPYYARDITLTGIELSPQMLTIAQNRAAELGITADLRRGDAANLPVDDGSADTVVCALSLCTIPDPERAIAEMSCRMYRCRQWLCSIRTETSSDTSPQPDGADGTRAGPATTPRCG
jgi:ubiquinone/menaquinone biosynthesis C-methylase UbiE